MAKKTKKKKKGNSRDKHHKNSAGGEPPSGGIIAYLVSLIVVAVAFAVYHIQRNPEWSFRPRVEKPTISEDALHNFMSWLQTNDEFNPPPTAWVVNANVKDTKSHRGLGVYLKKRMKLGETIVQIPINYVMTVDKARQSPVGQEISELMNDSFESLEELYIALLLLQEKENPNSFWKPYMDVLPTDFSNFPLFFRDSELGLTRDTWLQSQINIFNESAWTEWDAAQAAESFHWSWDEYIKARTILFSRMSVYQMDSEEYTYGLVPMLDMFNHNASYVNETINWRYDFARNAISVYALDYTLRKQEALVNYGKRSTALYLIQFGFVDEQMVDGDKNRALVVIDVPEELRDENYSDSTMKLQLSPKMQDQENIIIFSALRKITMNEGHQQEELSFYEATTQVAIEPQDYEHEIRTIELFVQFVKRSYDKIPSTSKADLDKAQTYAEHSNRRHILLVRASELLILEGFLDFAEVVVPLLKLENPEQLEEELQKLRDDPEKKKSVEKYEYHIQTVVMPLIFQKATPPKQPNLDGGGSDDDEAVGGTDDDGTDDAGTDDDEADVGQSDDEIDGVDADAGEDEGVEVQDDTGGENTKEIDNSEENPADEESETDLKDEK